MDAEELSVELVTLAETYARTDAKLRRYAAQRSDLVIKAVAMGMPKREVARLAGISRETVYRILRDADVAE